MAAENRVLILWWTTNHLFAVGEEWGAESWDFVHHVDADEVGHFGVHYFTFEELESEVGFF